jgi:hypothetical protein
MSCKSCNPGDRHETTGFTTEADFVREQSRVQQLISNGKVSVVKSNGWETEFDCVESGQRWHISTPDQAYRGFLKPVSATSLRIADLKENRRHDSGSSL